MPSLDDLFQCVFLCSTGQLRAEKRAGVLCSYPNVSSSRASPRNIFVSFCLPDRLGAVMINMDRSHVNF